MELTPIKHPVIVIDERSLGFDLKIRRRSAYVTQNPVDIPWRNKLKVCIRTKQELDVKRNQIGI